jgi:hypothetical protein
MRFISAIFLDENISNCNSVDEKYKKVKEGVRPLQNYIGK